MQWITVLIIAVGLALDAFAVSVSCGLAFRRREHAGALRIAFSFGLFQAGMPILGWLAGLGFRRLIEGVDHWIAFGLLAAIGGHMILEAMRRRTGEVMLNPPGLIALLGLSVATSIDALAIGLTLAVLHREIVGPAFVIGVVTFFISFLGIVVGHESKSFLRGHSQRNIQIAGGLVLLGIGVKILVEHLGG
jgi:manganese efflux pump family protein